MKRLLTVVFLCIACAAQAQLSYNNSDASWASFCLQPEKVKPARTDTCLVFVTNRHVYPDSLRFVDEFVDTCGLKYLLLRKQAGKWNVYQAGSLQEAMELLPEKKDIVVYAEGMGKIFTNNVQRALLMATQYNVNVVMFDYASINSTYRPSRNFKFARRNARLSAAQYFQLLRQLQQGRTGQQPWARDVRITTFYHSMGNIILRELMLRQPYQELNAAPFIDNVVINAACVPQKHHRQWVEQIRFARNVYIHYNRTDLQLKGAHLLTFTRQLGEKARRPYASNATYVNFHELVGWQHSYFLNFPYNDFRMPAPVKEYFSQVFSGHNAVLEDGKGTLLTRQTEKDRRMQ